MSGSGWTAEDVSPVWTHSRGNTTSWTDSETTDSPSSCHHSPESRVTSSSAMSATLPWPHTLLWLIPSTWSRLSCRRSMSRRQVSRSLSPGTVITPSGLAANVNTTTFSYECFYTHTQLSDRSANTHISEWTWQICCFQPLPDSQASFRWSLS